MLKSIVFCSITVRVLPVYVSCSSLHQQLYYSSSRSRNPYDVLGLKSTCSIKDVKEAYIKLCKELHPDMKPGDESQHKKFVELNDAYTALLNSKSKWKNFRRRSASGASNYNNIWRAGNQREKDSKDFGTSEKAWYERDEYQKFYQKYDEDDLMNRNFRKANTWVIAGCFILMVVGSILYLCAYSYATQYTQRTIDEKSKKIAESYLGVRQNLTNKGMSEQLDDLKKRWSN